MEFIVSRSGADLMITHSWCCVPSKKDLESMSAAGYTFKLNGKKIGIKALCVLRAENT
ncbi:MAG: hypothetical protein IKS39_07055 [Clostridia bacterium]|nr:hypothetical protein [Clostridia bacterium]